MGIATLPTTIVAGQPNHIAHHNEIHGFLNLFGAGAPWTDPTHTLYGAVGDGVADDTTPLNDAEADTPTGGILFLQADLTFLNTGWSVTHRITVVGPGATLKTSGAAAVGFSVLVQRAKLVGVKLDGSATSGSSVGLGVGGVATSAHHFSAYDVEITGYATGVKLQFSFYCGFYDVDSHANLNLNYQVTNLANNNHFFNCRSRGEAVTLVGVQFDDATANLTDSGWHGGTIEGAVIENCALLGVDACVIDGAVHMEVYAPAAFTGTVTLTNGSTAMSGAGTAFTTELKAGQWVKLDADGAGHWMRVQSITNNTTATLSEVYQGAGGSGAASHVAGNLRVANNVGTATRNYIGPIEYTAAGGTAPAAYIAGSYTTVVAAQISLLMVLASTAVVPTIRVSTFAVVPVDLAATTIMDGDPTQGLRYTKIGGVKVHEVTFGGAQNNTKRGDTGPHVWFVNAVEVARMSTLGLQTGSTWNGPHAVLGVYHLWVDSSGRLRIKSGAPTGDTDGTIVGTQS